MHWSMGFIPFFQVNIHIQYVSITLFVNQAQYYIMLYVLQINQCGGTEDANFHEGRNEHGGCEK